MAGAAPVAAGASPLPAHSRAFVTRRFLNWFPLGLTYAFLYMGRYNLTVSKNALGALMTNEDFGIIFGIGTLVYGFAFLANGPITDKIGGRKAMLIAALGSALANVLMGVYIERTVAAGAVDNLTLRFWLSVLYGANMYFQSFGAVAIVKVNSSWFHVRERGGFSGIFGTMISSGIFMAFTVNGWILASLTEPGGSQAPHAHWVFYIPSMLLFGMFVVESFLLRDRPALAGQQDFDTGDASSGEQGDVPLLQVMKRILTNPVILTVALIEFCTGIIRQGVMHWYPIYAKSVLALPSNHFMREGETDPRLYLGFIAVSVPFFFLAARAAGKRKGILYASGGLVFLAPFMFGGWGGILFVAGVIGGNVAGHVSDLFFQSRRAPAAGGLYGFLVVLAVLMVFAMGKTEPVVASTQLQGLLPGDRIHSIEGKGNFRDWPQVAAAFAALPPTCVDSTWDSARNVCSTRPTRTDPSLKPSDGTIRMEVERGGQIVALSLVDPKPRQRAGDTRTLAATPVSNRDPLLLGVVIFLMSLCVIGSHGLLSGTATMDFGGRKGAATAVGIIDGFVYLGTAVQSISLGYLTGQDWSYWPWFMFPFALIGFLLSLKIWNAKPTPKGPPAPMTTAMPAANLERAIDASKGDRR